MSECSIPNGRACLFTFLGFEFSKWRGGRAIACSGGPVTTTVPFSPDQRLVRSWLKLPHSLAIYGPTHCQTALQLEQRRRPCCVAPFGSAEARERERETRWIVDDGRNVANSQLLPLIVEIRGRGQRIRMVPLIYFL